MTVGGHFAPRCFRRDRPNGNLTTWAIRAELNLLFIVGRRNDVLADPRAIWFNHLLIKRPP